MSPKVINLRGGAKLIYERVRFNKSTTFMINFNTGSNQDGKISGLTHFLEHMLLKETKNKSYEMIINEYKKMGTQFNGSTSFEYINFFLTSANTQLERSVELLTEQVFSPAFLSESIENEKGVVRQEILRNKDNFDGNDYEHMLNKVFPSGGYDNDVLGTEKSLSKITKKELEKYCDDFFVGSDLQIYFVGNISKRKAIKLANKYVIEKTKVSGENIKKEYDNSFKGESVLSVLQNKSLSNSFVNIVFPVVCDKGYTQLALSEFFEYMLCGIDGLSMQVSRTEKGLTYTSGAFLDRTQHNYYFRMYYETEGRNINDVIKCSREILDRFIVTDKKLEEFKKYYKIKKDLEFYYDNEHRAKQLYMQYGFRQSFVDDKKESKAVENLSREVATDFIKSIIDKKLVYVTISTPIDKKQIMPLSEIEQLFFGGKMI